MTTAAISGNKWANGASNALGSKRGQLDGHSVTTIGQVCDCAVMMGSFLLNLGLGQAIYAAGYDRFYLQPRGLTYCEGTTNTHLAMMMCAGTISSLVLGLAYGLASRRGEGLAIGCSGIPIGILVSPIAAMIVQSIYQAYAHCP